MSRVQTPDQGDYAVRPGAGPVNRFSTPEQPLQEIGQTKAAALSNALSDLVPDLLKFSANHDQRQSEAAVLDARDKRAKNALTFQDAVKQGKISADQNPWFIKTWKEMDGSVAADRYNEDLLLALSSGPLANSTDHTESTKLLDNFRTNWVKANLQDQSQDYSAGFRAKAAGYELNARAHQAATVGNNIVAAAGDTLELNMHGIIGESYSRGISAEAVAEGINREADKALLVGMDPKDVNKMIIKAVAADAVDQLDVNHAQAILDAIKTGPGGKLGGTSAAKDVMEQVSSHVANELHQRDSWAHEEELRKTARVIAAANTSVGSALLDAQISGKPVTVEQFRPQIQAVLNTGNWEQAQNLEKAITLGGKENKSEATFVKESILTDIYSKHMVDFDRLNRALAAGEINVATYQTFGNKMNEIVALEKADAKEPSFYRNKGYLDRNTALLSAMGADEKIFNYPAAVLRLQASSQFWTQVFDWDKAHPKADSKEQIEVATTIAQQLLEDFRNKSFAGLGGSVSHILETTPGAQGGKAQVGLKPTVSPNLAAPDKLPPANTPAFTGPDDFNAALEESVKNPTSSRLAMMAQQQGIPLADFIAIQSGLFPEEPAKPAKK